MNSLINLMSVQRRSEIITVQISMNKILKYITKHVTSSSGEQN